MNLKYSTISSLIWKLLERSSSSIVQLVVQIVLARLLAPEDFGALAIILVFINLGDVIVRSGLNTALVQAPEIEKKDSSTVFWLSILLSIFLYVLIVAISPVIGEIYSRPDIALPMDVLALLLFINSFNAIQIAIIQRTFEFKKIFRATLIASIISGAIGVFAACLGLGLWALIIQQLLIQLLRCVILQAQIKWVPKFEFSIERAKVLYSFGWKLLVSGLLDQCYQGLSDLVIGKQFSSSSLGYVSQGKKYPQAIGSILNGAIQPVMLSAVSHVQADIQYVKRLVRRALKTSTFLIVPCMIFIVVVAEPLVNLILGKQWLPAVPFLQMYCLIYALLPIHSSNLQALNGMGRSDLFLKLEIIKKAYGVIFILIGAFVFQSIYILVGSYILSGVISTFVNAWPNRKVIGYSYGEQIRDICPAFLLSAVAAAVALPLGLLELPDIATIALQAVVMAGVYLGFSKLFKLEALEYLIATAKEVIILKRG